MSTSSSLKEEISLKKFKEKVLNDFRNVVLSREISVLGRREVLLGKGKFGIFGDGKELPQIAMSHFFKNGDFRSGYYRDMTLLLSQGLLTAREFFSAIYGHPDQVYERMSGGRQIMESLFIIKIILLRKAYLKSFLDSRSVKILQELKY